MAGGAVLVVGLGNPGPEYERTRHNIGRVALEVLADRLGTRFRPLKGVRAFSAEARDGDHRVILAEPTTYMNESGEAVAPLARYFKVDPANVIVLHDELDLPLGAIRVKRGGGDGGHNGLASVTRSLRTPEYIRVRIGIGRPPSARDGADFVLRAFAARESDEAAIAARVAADSVMTIIRDGLEAAREEHNKRPAKQPKPPPRAIRARATVDASPEEVFDAFTTAEGVRTFFAPAARIELAPRGAYEIAFDPGAPDGERGSEGCTVVAFERPRFLVFTWNAPPSIPSVRASKHRTRVELRFEPAAGGTEVSLEHGGWRDGPDWDEAFAYFERAWPVVLDRLQRRFRDGPIDWSHR